MTLTHNMIRVLLPVFLLALPLSGGCDSDTAKGPDEPCTHTDECEEGLTCVNRICADVIVCLYHTDCPEDYFCSLLQGGICAEQTPLFPCMGDPDCAPGYFCDIPADSLDGKGECAQAEGDGPEDGDGSSEDDTDAAFIQLCRQACDTVLTCDSPENGGAGALNDRWHESCQQSCAGDAPPFEEDLAACVVDTTCDSMTDCSRRGQAARPKGGG